ncbi:hypothetical protein [Amycolatopsis xylanica]|uniref:hypothetical protein n=1 Tax=Amycolatopsis xylanica TaxID=589385 RepID=UPI000B8A43FD|nr:hypothetical protein [Amycolatopsis xylanica]
MTSPGFAAPLLFTEGGNFSRMSGTTTVTTTPGRYIATLTCKGTPIPGKIGFTVLGTPPSAPAKPVVPAPAKHAQVVVPHGAPETGSGPN